ncbi:MAG: hypothetical protein QOH81_531 [Sphingomonadales bacterium]|jgi:hypothetical protein|nr:hypothetical protein [Sphingomonadales bacterium]
MFKLRIAAAAALFATAAPLAALPASAPVPGPGAPADLPVTGEEARQTAATLAQKLEQTYVFPDVARRYAGMLRANAASGAYDGFTSGRALAERLTADLRAVSPDNHLRVRAGAPGDGPRRILIGGPAGAGPATPGGPVRRVVIGGPADAAPASPPRRALPWKPIEEARWLTPQIAYIRFNVFPGDDETVAAARQFMIDHAGAKAIIFDNRTHHGGGLAEMNAMFPYLFAKPATLVTMDTRASVGGGRGGPAGDANMRLVPAGPDVVRREHYVLPSATEKRLFGAKVFVLTSGATGSAAEHMTLALKHTHRATIVGETTAGAGHYGGQEPIGDKFSVFIPVGRSFDPDTGRDWEGGGIAPDVAVPAEQALTEALVRAGLARAEAERLAAEVKPTGSMARRTPRT